MLLECTKCQLPYYDWEDLVEHYRITHPKVHRQQNRLDVRILKRMLNAHTKTYRCPKCYMPFPHPSLRDEHVELDECDPEDDSDCERELGEYAHFHRGPVKNLKLKFSMLRKRAGSSSSAGSSVSTSS